MAKEVIIELKAKTDRIEKDVEGINNEIKTLNKNVTKTEKGFEGVEKATQLTAKGVRKIGTTLKAIGIGLLLAAFSKLKEVFEQNQKVADAFNIAFESLSIAFNDFFNFLDANVGTVIDYFKSIFEDPKQSLIDFADAFKRNIQERFESYLDTLGLIGRAVKKVFSGDFAGALEDVKSAGKEAVDVITGVNNSFDKSVETVTKATSAIKGYVKSTVEAATETVDLNKQVQIANALQQGLIEKYDLQAEKQRQIRDDESKTIDERIKANEKLAEILDKQEKEMLENVNLRVEAAERELAKNKDNVELQVQLIEAQNELAGVQAQVAGFRSEQLTNINSLERERLDLIKEASEEEFELEMSRVKNKQMAVDAIAGLVNKESAIGKIAFIAKQGLILKEMMLTAKKALSEIAIKSAESGVDVSKGFTATLKAGFPKNVPLLIAYAAQAAGIVASMTSAVSKAKSQIPNGGVSVPTPTTPSPPAFNIVGQGSTNQLADVIAGQSQQPIQAFVVSNDISTAQELDRNIIEGASLG
ncbi:MAG: hypothetical protein CMJ25_18480 [Phycisphaerae bacterium]|nr:hypothetical protein [Phycisphaerae bacterium]